MFKMQLQENVFLWIAILTGVVLSVPLVSMQLTDEVNWGLADFAIMGLLVFGASCLIVIVFRRPHQKYRFVIGSAIIAAFLYVWAELAVGVFTGLGS